MRIDQVLATRLLSGDGMPTVRVYGWRPYALSIGFHQQVSDFDTTECKNEGIDVVRRPTGGRAILHAEEVTYSVVMRAEGRSVSEIYAEISQALVSGLRTLGADVEYASSQPDFARLYRQKHSIPCFSSSARFEIQSRGRKLVGSAQRRYLSPEGNEVVLQHGSILLGPAHRRISEFVRPDNDNVQAMILADLESKTTDLASVLGRVVTYDEVAASTIMGFCQAWNIDPVESPASDNELSDEAVFAVGNERL